jgi:hypothetical protein
LQPDRHYITLLTFTRGYGADQTFAEVLDIFVQTAAGCTDPHLTFLIKTKDADDTRALTAMLADRKTANIRIDHTIPMTKALAGSRVIVGYNSLSVIDALLSGGQIILPGWGECLTEGDMCMYPKASQSERFFTYATSPSALVTALTAATTTDQARARPDPDMLAYIQQFVSYDPDRLNSTAFEQIALDHVRQRQAAGNRP